LTTPISFIRAAIQKPGAGRNRPPWRERIVRAVTRWIVDGMNVIGSRPDGWWRDRRGAMERLVRELEALEEPVTVVLDGRPFDLQSDNVDVVFASRRGPNAADDDIATMVSDAADPGGITVVTSDADLEHRVREHGANVQGAGSFRRRLG
jgi:predicted RNA-binding protein with PIN domain